MGTFIKGDVVVIPFPFSDLTNSVRRPALVLADLIGDDVILCQITSQMNSNDPYSISLNSSDFVQGGLSRQSNIRPNRLFTADENIILSSAGKVSSDKIQEVVNGLRSIIENN